MTTAAREKWHLKYIGDEIKIKGNRYMVTANYPKDGYLLALPSNGKLFKKETLKIRYSAAS